MLHSLALIAGFVVFIVVVTVLGIILGLSAFAILVMAICAAAVTFGTVLAVFAALVIGDTYRRIRLHRKILDPLIALYPDAKKVR